MTDDRPSVSEMVEDAEEVAQVYAKRWKIEVFYRNFLNLPEKSHRDLLNKLILLTFKLDLKVGADQE